MTGAKENMALIQATFQEAKEMALSISDLNKLNERLLKFSPEFISVAYEGASNGVALQSIEQTNTLKNWNTFYNNYGKPHSSQMHVGLGWAFSELNLHFSSFDIAIEPLMRYRVLDGYGYHEGIFKRRQSIRTQQTPEHFNALNLRAYNQGLGRSFWYIAQGEVDKLTRIISLFPEDRRHDMWRGIGIAVTYVGGIDLTTLQQLTTEAGSFLPDFKCGASLLIQSRHKAGTIVDDTATICDELFGTTCIQISERLAGLEEKTNSTPEQLYFDWIKNIETELCL